MSLDSLGFVLEKHCPKQRKMVKSGERSLRLSRKSRSSAGRDRAWARGRAQRGQQVFGWVLPTTSTPNRDGKGPYAPVQNTLKSKMVVS